MEPFSQLYTYYVILYLEIYQDIGYKNISVGRTFSSIFEDVLMTGFLCISDLHLKMA